MPSGVFKRSPEHIANIKKANTGLKRSQETRDKISASKKGRKLKPPTPERAAQNSANRKAGARRGKDHHFFGKGAPEWAIAKISATHKGMSYKVCRSAGITPDQYRAERAAGKFWCGLCRRFLNESESSAKANQCKDCAPKYQRASVLKRQFGVDAEWYETKLTEQGGCCAICRLSDKVSKNGFLAIDHNHSTGVVRGLLCTRCNVTVGLIESSVYGSCLEYLKAYGDTAHIPEPSPSVVIS